MTGPGKRPQKPASKTEKMRTRRKPGKRPYQRDEKPTEPVNRAITIGAALLAFLVPMAFGEGEAERKTGRNPGTERAAAGNEQAGTGCRNEERQAERRERKTKTTGTAPKTERGKQRAGRTAAAEAD